MVGMIVAVRKNCWTTGLFAFLALVLLGNARAAFFRVTANTDDGPGSLRQAINAANSNAPGSIVGFHLPPGSQTIQLLSPLPPMTNTMIIDGWTQPGFAGIPLVELDGEQAGTNANGLVILAPGTLVRGLVINRFSFDGILIYGGGSNVLQGNVIGTDALGTNINVPNMANGIDIQFSPGNLIGGLVPGQGNLLSGNYSTGLVIGGQASVGNVVLGNFVGTAANGKGTNGNFISGIGILDASNNTIGGTNNAARNIVSGNFGNGLEIIDSDSTNNIVQGNYVGVDVTGKLLIPNEETGIYLFGATQNLIGGSVPGAGNLVTGNKAAGVTVDGMHSDGNGYGNAIQGNWIGLDASGTKAPGNILYGVSIFSAPSTLLGGTNPGARNIISANTEDGVYLYGSGTVETVIYGNYVGTAPDGITPMGNLWYGIEFDTDDVGGPRSTVVGGTEPGQANVIAYTQVPTRGSGVRVRSGSASTTIRGNSTFVNAGLGIDVGIYGVHQNTPQNGPDDKGSRWQNYPVLKGAMVDGVTHVHGTLNSYPLSSFLIDFYANTATNASGNGEGGAWIGAIQIKTDAKGDGVFSAKFLKVGEGQFISATATGPTHDTSEFSATLPADFEGYELEVTQRGSTSGGRLIFTTEVINHAPVPALNVKVTIHTPSNSGFVSSLLNGLQSGIVKSNAIVITVPLIAADGKISIVTTFLPQFSGDAIASATVESSDLISSSNPHTASAILHVAPALVSSVTTNGLSLRWVGTPGKYILQHTKSLALPVTWDEIATAPDFGSFAGTNSSLNIPLSPGFHSFRLSAP